MANNTTGFTRIIKAELALNIMSFPDALKIWDPPRC